VASPNHYSGAELLDFVTTKMAMSAFYQPAIIRSLILAPGQRMPAHDLARQLLLHDSFAVSKMLKTLMRWPKITLARHGIAFYDRIRREFVLPVLFDSDQQRDEVLAACADAISNWERKEAPKAASRFYKLIEAAGGRCQACGILASARPLDIDHIIPREQARRGVVRLADGTTVPVDDERNLQVLCARCNRGKRDTSIYDFRLTADRFAETISITLQLAKHAGYDHRAVLAAAMADDNDADVAAG
jgi:ATP adenylyltransferase